MSGPQPRLAHLRFHASAVLMNACASSASSVQGHKLIGCSTCRHPAAQRPDSLQLHAMPWQACELLHI